MIFKFFIFTPMGDRQIQDAVQKLAGTYGRDHFSLIPCTVTAVSQADRTCDCLPIGGESVTEIDGVHLMSEVDDGWLVIPAIGSTVIVGVSIKNVPYIVLFSQIYKAFLVTLSGIQLQGGELGGLPISSEVTTKLNNLENAFNLLNTKVNTLAPTPVIPNLVPTETSDIENTAITQGAL